MGGYSSYSKRPAVCIKFNKYDGDCKFGRNCKYQHVCSGTFSYKMPRAGKMGGTARTVTRLARVRDTASLSILLFILPNRYARL